MTFQSEGSFKDRVMARAQWPESKFVEDRRGDPFGKQYGDYLENEADRRKDNRRRSPTTHPDDYSPED